MPAMGEALHKIHPGGQGEGEGDLLQHLSLPTENSKCLEKSTLLHLLPAYPTMQVSPPYDWQVCYLCSDDLFGHFVCVVAPSHDEPRELY